jgi:myo-inositol-1-phosphate synthase
MRRAKVLDVSLQDQLYDGMHVMKPLPSIYFPDFIAANQADRADNVLRGSKQEQLEKVRQDIREFKEAMGVETVVVLWTANTERFAAIEEGINDTAEHLLAAVARGEDEV